MPNTVFVLGAGASKRAGGPLMDDFIDIARDVRLATDLDDADKQSIDRVFTAIGALEKIYSRVPIDLENIEDLFATFEMMNLLGVKLEGVGEPAGLVESIKVLIVQTLTRRILLPVVAAGPNQQGRVHPPEPYRAFVEMIRSLMSSQSLDRHRIALVTFNYDLALDYALHFVGIHADYCLDPHKQEHGVRLLKLHGSLNWGRCSKCGSTAAYHLKDFFKNRNWPILDQNSAPVKLDVARHLGAVLHCEHHPLNHHAPVIVPPTWNKTRHYDEIATVWQAAVNTLLEADNIVVVGYSLPPGDQFFRLLLAFGLGQRVRKFRVYDPGVAVEQRYRDTLGPRILRQFKREPGLFEQSIQHIRDSIDARP
jgi:hypothetical protein